MNSIDERRESFAAEFRKQRADDRKLQWRLFALCLFPSLVYSTIMVRTEYRKAYSSCADLADQRMADIPLRCLPRGAP